jgi:hypothetical protein
MGDQIDDCIETRCRGVRCRLVEMGSLAEKERCLLTVTRVDTDFDDRIGVGGVAQDAICSMGRSEMLVPCCLDTSRAPNGKRGLGGIRRTLRR